jgi:hypothetical protein
MESIRSWLLRRMSQILASSSAVSSSGSKKAILRKEKDGEKLFVDVWRNDVLEVSKDVTKFHGPFYDGIFLSVLRIPPRGC